jgi:rubrerythrin
MGKNLEGIIQSGEHPLVVASLLCSNYEQASQKQKRDTMSKLFGLLARSFQLQAQARQRDSLKSFSDDAIAADLQDSAERDLQKTYAGGENRMKELGQRAALRALTWGGKVSAIQKSLIKRYLKLGDQLLKEGQALYVCQACGFIGIGDAPPDTCPVCKAPSSRFTEVKQRRS